MCFYLSNTNSKQQQYISRIVQSPLKNVQPTQSPTQVIFRYSLKSNDIIKVNKLEKPPSV